MENKQRQIDEIEALQSIYGDQWQTEDEQSQAYSVAVTEGQFEVVIHLKLSPQYPTSAPPQYLLSAPSLHRSDKQCISTTLESIYLENIGESIIYQWVEAVREFLHNKCLSGSISESDRGHEIRENRNSGKISRMEIIHGEAVLDRKSTFQAHAALITSEEQVKQVLSLLLDYKKVSQATHNVYAYRVLQGGVAGRMAEDCDDDGENAAGGRLLHLLQATEATNVMVVVSRWRGGVNIGADRFRHINSVARQVLQQLGFVKKSKK